MSDVVYAPIKKGDIVMIMDEGDWYMATGICTEAVDGYAYLASLRFPTLLYEVNITNRNKIVYFKDYVISKRGYY
ncbi:hypothetical protein NNC19_19345 [Clostridium sp. SHJSY1]|uniref:hypothetical protein n=1 Tax=Clostridium sp. SHJSY1 TaxID=2942483 RepID=UPI0028742734|nr:hypothetical protein [Clostridium sp. SHJSY1]MDS0527851.1 hypothetical protein [Clostridium sp. SHJSY1]